MATLTDCPTFIDLRAFAMQAEFPAGDDPFGADRCTLPLREAPVEIGSVRLPRGTGEARAKAGDIWMVAVEGKVTLGDARGTTTLEAGQSCVVASGTPFVWSASASATLLYMHYLPGGNQGQGIVPILNDSDLAPSNPPSADLLIGATPSCRSHTSFRSSDGEFTCGIWDSTPYHRHAMYYRHFELMVLLQGSVTFVDEQDRSATFHTGDIFLLEQGARCSWESREDVVKIFALYRPIA